MIRTVAVAIAAIAAIALATLFLLEPHGVSEIVGPPQATTTN